MVWEDCGKWRSHHGSPKKIHGNYGFLGSGYITIAIQWDWDYHGFMGISPSEARKHTVSSFESTKPLVRKVTSSQWTKSCQPRSLACRRSIHTDTNMQYNCKWYHEYIYIYTLCYTIYIVCSRVYIYIIAIYILTIYVYYGCMSIHIYISYMDMCMYWYMYCIYIPYMAV